MPLEEFIEYRLTKVNLAHDFSLGALFVYHQLEEKLAKGKAKIQEGGNVVSFYKKSSEVLFVYDPINTELLLKGSVLNTRYPIEGATRFKEVVYTLNSLEQYSGNKRYHSVNKPINIIENRPDLGIELTTLDRAGQAALKDLHNEWVDYKLNLPGTHRISFPTARYRRTLDEYPIEMWRRAIYIKGQLYGFITFSLEGTVAFELSFCSLFWKPEFKILNGLNQYIFSYCLLQLKKEGIKFVNSGFALNKNLKIFKQTAQRSVDVYRYEYKV